MKIDRSGSYRDHGNSSIELNSPKFSWNAYSGKLEIRQEAITDFNTESRHDYRVTLTTDEIAKLLEAVLAGVESKSGKSIIDAIMPHAAQVQRLAATLVPPFNVQSPE